MNDGFSLFDCILAKWQNKEKSGQYDRRLNRTKIVITLDINTSPRKVSFMDQEEEIHIHLPQYMSMRDFHFIGV